MKRFLNIILGCLLVSAGLIILRHSQVVTGGTAGLSLTLSYLVNAPFALLFFVINIPFYLFSIVRMGWNFTLFTILSVSLVSLMTAVDRLLPEFTPQIIVGTVSGSILCGLGLSVLFINRASLGGVNIVALFLQKKWNWNPGLINFIFDSIIVILGFYSVGLLEAILSILSVFIVSGIISNFKKKIAAGGAAKGGGTPTYSAGPKVEAS